MSVASRIFQFGGQTCISCVRSASCMYVFFLLTYIRRGLVLSTWDQPLGVSPKRLTIPRASFNVPFRTGIVVFRSTRKP